MDKAAIRDRLEEFLTHLAGCAYFNGGPCDCGLEAAFTQAYEQGWNEAVEAAAEICGRVQTTQGEAAAIRRLRIEGKGD